MAGFQTSAPGVSWPPAVHNTYTQHLINVKPTTRTQGGRGGGGVEINIIQIRTLFVKEQYYSREMFL